jgi:hypothetical protein
VESRIPLEHPVVHPRFKTSVLESALLLWVVLAGCSDAAQRAVQGSSNSTDTDPQLVFWASLQSLCGKAFEGSVVENDPPDPSFEGRLLTMHVRECDLAEVRIPFTVGDDRSRSWVVTPTAAGLRLKHDHRHEDGSEDEITQYGGETRGRGTDTSQDFAADGYTSNLVPSAATNVWTIEVWPDSLFAYALRREGSERRFRVEFDLTRPVPPPPAPWGAGR